jgi:nitric oxide reductase subunit B
MAQCITSIFQGSLRCIWRSAHFSPLQKVIPLTILTLEAWSFLQLGAQQGAKSQTPFPHFWAVMFLASVGFWNFLGAGIFGFLINLPIASYYEIGTALTANHGHAATMGVYGMLGVGLASRGQNPASASKNKEQGTSTLMWF